MGPWQTNGRPADAADLEDLGLTDQTVLCDCNGVSFRFTAETVDRGAQGIHAHGAVLTLRQLERRSELDAIDLVEIVEDGRPCRSPSGKSVQIALAAAFETCDRVGRRYASRRLFQTAERLLADRDIA